MTTKEKIASLSRLYDELEVKHLLALSDEVLKGECICAETHHRLRIEEQRRQLLELEQVIDKNKMQLKAEKRHERNTK